MTSGFFLGSIFCSTPLLLHRSLKYGNVVVLCHSQCFSSCRELAGPLSILIYRVQYPWATGPWIHGGYKKQASQVLNSYFEFYSCVLSIYITCISLTSSSLTDWTSHSWLVGLIFSPAAWGSETVTMSYQTDKVVVCVCLCRDKIRMQCSCN